MPTAAPVFPAAAAPASAPTSPAAALGWPAPAWHGDIRSGLRSWERPRRSDGAVQRSGLTCAVAAVAEKKLSREPGDKPELSTMMRAFLVA
jgi:hypothetical protein